VLKTKTFHGFEGDLGYGLDGGRCQKQSGPQARVLVKKTGIETVAEKLRESRPWSNKYGRNESSRPGEDLE